MRKPKLWYVESLLRWQSIERACPTKCFFFPCCTVLHLVVGLLTTIVVMCFSFYLAVTATKAAYLRKNLSTCEKNWRAFQWKKFFMCRKFKQKIQCQWMQCIRMSWLRPNCPHITKQDNLGSKSTSTGYFDQDQSQKAFDPNRSKRHIFSNTSRWTQTFLNPTTSGLKNHSNLQPPCLVPMFS